MAWITYVLCSLVTLVTAQQPLVPTATDSRLQTAINIYRNAPLLVRQLRELQFGEDSVFPKLRAAMDWASPRLPAVVAVDQNVMPVLEPFPSDINGLTSGQSPIYFPNPPAINATSFPVYVPFRRPGVRFPIYFPFDRQNLTLQYPMFPVFYQYEKQVNGELYPVWISYQRDGSRPGNYRPPIAVPFQRNPRTFPSYVHFELQTNIPTGK